MKIKGFDSDGNEAGIWDSTHEAAAELNIDQANISKAARGQRVSAGGYTWKYIDVVEPEDKFQLKEENRTDNKTGSAPNDYGKKLTFSAVSPEGKFMSIDEYCGHYGLPREDISSYKAVTHTAIPFYNIVFKENILTAGGITIEDIDRIITERVDKFGDFKPFVPIDKRSTPELTTFDRCIYSDAHIGMDVNKEGNALYPEEWDRDVQLKVADKVGEEILRYKKSNTLYIDELGDMLDGWNGQTTRGGHSLPQNMSNVEAFETALDFKMSILDKVAPQYTKVVCNNVVMDNHSGSFSHILGQTVKRLAELKYRNVEVKSHNKFINHYIVGDHAFVISHGKDDKNLKFGFKPILDPKQAEKIDQYIKEFNIYREAKYIEFSKGDSHQFLLDYSTSADFDYFNYPAISPASQWVQTNFKKSVSGFVIQTVDYRSNRKIITPIIF